MNPPNPDTFDIVIAGAGFAGLATAKALADGMGKSARIAVVMRERWGDDEARADSRSIALSAASVRMLAKLGVWSACEPLSQPVTAIDITDSSLRAGIRPVLLSYDNSIDGTEAASQIVPNAALEKSLSAAVAACSSVTIIDASTVSSFQANPSNAEITLSPARTLTAKLLIAADGRRSALRDKAGIKTIGWPYNQSGIVVTVRHDRPHNGRAVQHFLPGGPFAMLPLLGNRTCITWSEGTPEATRLMALDDEAFIAELERRAGGRLGAIELDGPRKSWPLELFVARTFIAERFALIGDAAHCVHPIAGQGLNLGLRDCAALAETIVDAHRLGLDIAHGTTLERYDRWRRFDTMSSAAGFDALNRLFSTDGRLRRSAREFGLGLVDRLPGLKHRLVTEAAGLTGDVPRLLRGEAI
ncbi:MAG: FAD-dependent monooxygenase [Hyphomicrobiaceae bacterium]